ncbi:MAG: hypothetical protein JNJ54_31300 [Myxococcaceae bacterium]|nr:hypothetical protein [Myxococcaceae bacterium]
MHDVVAPRFVGANLEGVPHELFDRPAALLALTDGELGPASYSRARDDEGRPLLVVTSPRGEWRVQLEPDETIDLVRLAGELNRALESCGAQKRLVALTSGQFAWASPGEAARLAAAGLLDDAYDVPASTVRSFPLEPTSRATMWPTGQVQKGLLAAPTQIQGLLCAPGPLELDSRGGLELATLAAPHVVSGLSLPNGTVLRFWERGDDGAPGRVESATLPATFAFGGLELPAGTELRFDEGGQLLGACLGGDVLVGGGRAEQGDVLDYDEQRGWSCDSLFLPDASEPSVLDDPDVKSLTDLARLYPLPSGFEYQERDGQARVVRLADGGVFSILLEGEILRFWDTRGARSRTTEVERVR